jgi:hypothetical protein
VVEMAVTANDRLDLERVDVEAAHVVHHAIGARTGIEKDPVLATMFGHRDEHREAVLGEQLLGGLAFLHRRDRPSMPRDDGRPARRPLVGHEDIGHVVHQCRHCDRVDRFEIEDHRWLHLVESLVAVAMVGGRVVRAHHTIINHRGPWCSPCERTRIGRSPSAGVGSAAREVLHHAGDVIVRGAALLMPKDWNALRVRKAALFAVTARTAVIAAALTLVPAASAAEPVTVPRLVWLGCGGGFECATAQVPLDYSQPNGATISLALIRLPAPDPAHRIGSLPRFPVGTQEQATFISTYQQFDNKCLRRNATIMPHMATADVARDLDLLRQAVGIRRSRMTGSPMAATSASPTPTCSQDRSAPSSSMA